MSDNKHINIGPQDAESWFCIAVAIAVWAVAYVFAHTSTPNDVEIERIKAQAETRAKP
jgi:beta-lactam-binding protein with PASTA domain